MFSNNIKIQCYTITIQYQTQFGLICGKSIFYLLDGIRAFLNSKRIWNRNVFFMSFVICSSELKFTSCDLISILKVTLFLRVIRVNDLYDILK